MMRMADRLDLRRRLQDVAFSQAGYFTAAQAKDVGYSYQAQKYHADRGNWVRIDRGLFRLPGWPSDADDLYTRWYVWSEGRAVISYGSAAAVHDLGDLDAGPVHLTLADSKRSADGAVLHPDHLESKDAEQRGPFRVTTVARTVLDLATWDLSQEQLNSVVRDALASGRLGRTELRRRMDGFGPAAALRLERALADDEEPR